MLETKEKETKKTELQKPTGDAPIARTPFTFMRRFADDMERMFEDFDEFGLPKLFSKEFSPFKGEMRNAEWAPPMEVLQKDGELTVRCDLPGLEKDDIKVELKDEFLLISGERNERKEEKGEGFYRTERRYGSFYRQLPLPAGVKADTAEATFDKGVLEVKMKAPAKEPVARKLEIKEPTGAKAATAAA